MVTDCHRLSQIVTDCHRLSQIVTDCHRLSDCHSVPECPRASQSVTVSQCHSVTECHGVTYCHLSEIVTVSQCHRLSCSGHRVLAANSPPRESSDQRLLANNVLGGRRANTRSQHPKSTSPPIVYTKVRSEQSRHSAVDVQLPYNYQQDRGK